MLTIHGVPLSVHTRKTIVTAILKKLDYRLEVVIPVIPGNPPPNWSELSPTGLIPVMQNGDFRLADSTAICLYLERTYPSTAILPADPDGYGRALWFDAYAGGTLFRNVVHPLFHQMVVHPKIRKEATDQAIVDTVLGTVQPRIFGYLDSQATGQFLVGDAMSIADIAVVSNFVVYQYMGFYVDPDRYPALARYLRGIVASKAFATALAGEKPFVEQMGLDRSFLH
ncbi:glutathione S-transferase family protein [Mesorhizobium sp. LHD-90]|uniref:glutathione S-transferase family protein n=1 Tax=Mesorhizobium sp. LHD-90 TaxID=3071414 RepID=UPI0027E1CB41|nr:glutathione S-transferase family protein [Mesorhizobium sp. LHD-90]MDQ6434802.1 glutathione S-transferase family protein [Mesorhizobium sp. LHD-90]